MNAKLALSHLPCVALVETAGTMFLAFLLAPPLRDLLSSRLWTVLIGQISATEEDVLKSALVDA